MNNTRTNSSNSSNGSNSSKKENSVNSHKLGVIPQVLQSALAIVVLYLTLMTFQNLYSYFNNLSSNRTNILPNTYTMESSPMTIDVNPNDKKSIPLALSNNERTGPEFTYSFFLNIQPNSFRDEDGLLHIFSKGYPSQFPLLCPGVYMKSNTNTLRVYINTYQTWNNYCDVNNFPIGKWVHVALVCRSTHAEIYVNTNLKSRLPFNGFQAYQNYENICCFSKRKITLPTTIPSLNGGNFNVFGCASGFLSKLVYFNYAVSFDEIQTLAEQGPSSKLSGNDISIPPPYLTDTWWTQQY